MTYMHRFRTVIGVFASVLVLVNMIAMLPASASASRPCVAVVGFNAGHQKQSDAPAGCCSDMHCCLMLPYQPDPMVPVAVKFKALSLKSAEQALLLVRPIDPPPRVLAA
ncbi:hypothetical protein [uncultured Rhizobium sp.]|uniref:hypothetical protein n=1 Tax=unclassified Neorhizobium TaxID=2629175 RepID=UPI002D809EB9|nr:hypothetical protein [uncultured Rhizobium sp.]